MKKHTGIIFTLLTLLSSVSLAHGEDKPGPNGGYIRMPSNFHTEVVKEKTGYRIYLLDMSWKNPSVLDSSVQATLVDGAKKTDLNCTKDLNSFLCKSKLTNKGQLHVTAKREGQTGAVAIYNLPLRFEKPAPEQKTGHDGHH